MQAFEDLKNELRSYGGSCVEIRLVGLNKGVQERFKRAWWKLVSPYDDEEDATTFEIEGQNETKDLIFDHLPHAIMYQSQGRASISNFDFDEELKLEKR